MEAMRATSLGFPFSVGGKRLRLKEEGAGWVEVSAVGG